MINMAKHHPRLIFYRQQAGVAIGRCVICGSYVRPRTLLEHMMNVIMVHIKVVVLYVVDMVVHRSTSLTRVYR